MIDQYALRSTGIRPSQWRLYWERMKTIDVLLPEPGMQRAIADFLDHEIARLDTLIAKQEQLIATLRERREAVIVSTILRGVDPLHSPRSGSYVPIGSAFSVTLGKMLDAGKGVHPEDSLLPYIRAANIQDSGLDLSNVNRMPYSRAEAASLDLRAGDLLVVEGGAVGTSVALMEDMPGWSFQKTVNRVRPLGAWSSAWLGYVLRAYRDAGVIDILCNKSTIPHLTAEKLRAIRVPETPPIEQRAAASSLDDETRQIDTLISKAERFIELSKERRSALITAAVTGQIDVRGEVA
jgi:type I restriction enzyme S subunit